MLIKTRFVSSNTSGYTFEILPKDEEGYHEIIQLETGRKEMYWKPKPEDTFQNWLDTNYRPGTVEIVSIQE